MSGCKIIVYGHDCDEGWLDGFQEYVKSFERAVMYAEECEECPICGGYVKTEIWEL